MKPTNAIWQDFLIFFDSTTCHFSDRSSSQAFAPLTDQTWDKNRLTFLRVFFFFPWVSAKGLMWMWMMVFLGLGVSLAPLLASNLGCGPSEIATNSNTKPDSGLILQKSLQCIYVCFMKWKIIVNRGSCRCRRVHMAANLANCGEE